MRTYEKFITDYFNESDDWAFLVEDKTGVYKDNYYLKTNLQKNIISPVLAKQSNRDKIVEMTGMYMDKNATKLSTPGPVYIITFTSADTKVLYEMFDLTPEGIIDIYLKMVDETYYGKISAFFTGWVKNAPHKLLITAVLAEACEKGYDEIIECCEYLWAFAVYPALFREYWRTGVKEDVMSYTIEHLSGKYKVKQVKNLKELLKYDATTVVEFYKDLLKDGKDNVYMDLMQRMHTQINSKLRKISNAYYANSENNNTQHNDPTQFDDGELADQEGHTTNAANIIEKTMGKFASKEINSGMIKIAANASQVDVSTLSGFITQIYATKGNRLGKFVEDIIMTFFTKNPSATAIGNSEFLNYGLSLYRSIGTSKDVILMELKSILSMWMNDIINIRSQYNREATVISYTRAIFNYIILMINYYN